MKNVNLKRCAILACLLFLAVIICDATSFARIGGGRSFGSRGSRSFSLPSRSYQQPSPSRQQSPSNYQPAPSRQQSGGFLRSIGGGLLGGFLGGMLFRSLGFGAGGMGGGSFGLFDIILIGGIGYLIYRMIKRRRQEGVHGQSPSYLPGNSAGDQFQAQAASSSYDTSDTGPDSGISHIRQMDPSFDESRFCDHAMDIFFRIQGAWMNRNLDQASGLLTSEMGRMLQEDVDRLLREKRINRLENIAVRNTDIVEAWQESGQDYITVRFYANLIDYTTDETGTVVDGSRTDPVKFEEYWTFTRPVGAGEWKLSAITQP